MMIDTGFLLAECTYRASPVFFSFNIDQWNINLNILVELWWPSFKEMSIILFHNDVTTDWRHTYKVTNAQRSFLIRWFYTTRCLNCGTNFATKQKNHILWCGVKFCGVEWCFGTYKSTFSKYTHSLVDYTEWFRKCM